MFIIQRNTDFLSHPVFTKKRLHVFLLHWLVWIVLYFLTYIPTYIAAQKIVGSYVVFTYLIFPTVNFLLFYLVAFYLMPQIGIKHKRWIWFTISCIFLVLAVTYFKFVLDQVRLSIVAQQLKLKSEISHFTIPVKKYSTGLLLQNYFKNNVLYTIYIVILAFTYRMLLSWYLQEKIRKELENKKLQAELSFLKMQVNPHFLFNALNNIYSLAVLEKSTKTGNSIMKLSELIRYLLYEKEDEAHKVSLDKEIRHINSFIDLEKLRHLKDVFIHFSIEGDTAGKKIVPLLLFPLIENACKHGILTDANKPVEIALKINENDLVFTCENYINSYQKDKNGGIGLANVQKRLELLYGKQYPIYTQNMDGKFIVRLQLPL